MTTPGVNAADLLAKFEKHWNLFLDDAKASFKRDYLPPTSELQELRATPESAPYLLMEVVGKPLLPHAVAIAAKVEDFLNDPATVIDFSGIRVSDMYRDAETSPATREALAKYVTAFYIMASSAPASIYETLRQKQEGGKQEDPTKMFGPELANLMNDLTKELLEKPEVKETLEEAIKSDAIKNLESNPFSLIAEMGKEDSPLAKAVQVMGAQIQNKLEDASFRKTIEEGMPKMMESVLKSMNGTISREVIDKTFAGQKGGAMPDIAGLAKMMGGLMGGGNPLEMLSGLMGGRTKKQDETMPELDDIEREVRKKSQKDFREAMQRELLRKKLEKRRNEKSAEK